MCFICSSTQTFDPQRHTAEEGRSFAALTETTDAAASLLTTYVMSVGDSFSGTISTDGDRDWISITLTAGETYQISLNGSDSGSGSLSDPFLRLYDSTGTFITQDDDSGTSLNAALTYTAATTGTYYISAGAWADYVTGTYQLSVSEAATPTPGTQVTGTLDELADFLISGYWEADGDAARSFDTSGDNQITVNLTGLTAAGQQLARWAFEAWERVADLVFVETSSSAADIVFDDSDSGAYATSVTSGSTILSSTVNVSTDWLSSSGTVINSYSLQTYIHEIGHALGLGHLGDYNGDASYGSDETFTNDSWQVSVMSYFDQEDNTSITASFAYVASAMMADILAIQELYGTPDANGSETAGDTVWGANTTLTDSYLYDVFAALDGRSTTNMNADAAITLTIYDVGGTDMLDFSNNTTNDRIDLNDESYSNVSGLTGNVAIARGTVIENVIAGSGNDTLIGNEADNLMRGGNGADTISGGDGNDTLSGGDSSNDLRDVIYGGNGDDRIDGGYGNDELRGDAGNDTIEGGFGVDTVIGGVGNDVLTGSAWSDEVFGGEGEDFINGGFGSDRVNGGDDGDRFYHLGIFDHGSDWIQDYDASEGDVLVFGQAGATIDQFQVNFTETTNAGTAGVEEAFVIYRPTGQIMWALVDGGAQDEIILRLGGVDHDLLA